MADCERLAAVPMISDYLSLIRIYSLHFNAAGGAAVAIKSVFLEKSDELFLRQKIYAKSNIFDFVDEQAI